MPLTIVRNDITKLTVDAIVNAANTQLRMGGGICGAIFSAAGAQELQNACDKLSPIQMGEAVLTKGFGLSAKYIIHAAGPIYQGGKQNEEYLLRSCYSNSLDLAKEYECESIAFPIISSGIYGYPKAEALSVATSEIGLWLSENEMDVFLVVFDKAAFAIMKDLHNDIDSFIDENYIEKKDKVSGRVQLDIESTQLSYHEVKESANLSDITAFPPEFDKFAPDVFREIKGNRELQESRSTASLFNINKQLEEPFSDMLFRLIDAKGKTDVEVYKRANLDRKLFSKIRTGKGYMPSKKTAVALAVSLELSLTETRDLLERAGFALSKSVMFDVIIEYFISRKRYDIFEINNVLFEYDQPLLGG